MTADTAPEEKDISSPAVAAPIASKVQLLLQLAERCEREEPSRELDCRIWLALFDKPIMVDGGGYGPKAHAPQYKNAREIFSDDWPHWGNASDVKSIGLELEAGAYTTSLDAAVTLVPEGWSYVLRNIREHMSQASVFPHFTQPGVEGSARTLVLALCAAALRARAALEQEAAEVSKDRDHIAETQIKATP